MEPEERASLDERTPVGEIVVASAAAAKLFERVRVDYYNAGAIPLAEACAKAGADLSTVLAAIRETPAERIDWRAETARALSHHIEQTHHVLTRSETNDLTSLSERVRQRHVSRFSELQEVQRLADVLEQELLQHMMKEEQILFPFVTSMETAISAGDDPPVPFFGTVRNPIYMMVQEHDAVGDMLDEFRRLTNDYTIPAGADTDLVELYRRMTALEEDIHFHIHLENNIYFPRSIALEQRAGG